MVRNYIPRLDRVRGDKIRAAIRYHRATGASQRETCELYGLTRSLFQKYLKVPPGDIPEECCQGTKPVFTREQEKEIVRYVHMLANRFYAMTRASLAELAYCLAVQNDIEHPFTGETAGNGWVTGFLDRHEELSLRTGTPTSLLRITEFNREAVYRFFDLLSELVSEHGFTADTIYNMDESCLTIVPSKQPKRIGRRGIRTLPVMVPVERGRLCTITCGFSAGGHFIPPMFISPGNSSYVSMDGAPPNSIHASTPKGWSNMECFLKWLKHFRRYAGRSPEERVLLILDNHSSHISYKAVRYCRRNRIELLTLPPYCTHKMQPCDISLFSPLKAKYSDYLIRWLQAHPFRKPRLEDIPSIFGLAFKDAAKRDTAVNGFRKTGIWQYNPVTETWGPNKHAFDDEFDEREANQDTDTDSDDDDSGPDMPDNFDSPPNSPHHARTSLTPSPESLARWVRSLSPLPTPSLSPSPTPSTHNRSEYRQAQSSNQIGTVVSVWRPEGESEFDRALESSSNFVNSSINMSEYHDDQALTREDNNYHSSPSSSVSSPTGSSLGFFGSLLSQSIMMQDEGQQDLVWNLPVDQSLDQPRGLHLDQPRGPPLDQPRGLHLDQPRGPPLDQPRGLHLDQPRGPPLDQPRGLHLDQPRGPPLDQPRGLHLDQPRGPPLDQPRGLHLDQPRGPPLDQPRGLHLDQPRGPPLDQPRGLHLDQPRGPPLDQPRGLHLDQPRGPPLDQPRGLHLDQPRGPPLDQPRGLHLDQPRGPPLDQPRGPPPNQARAHNVEHPPGMLDSSSDCENDDLAGETVREGSIRKRKRKFRKRISLVPAYSDSSDDEKEDEEVNLVEPPVAVDLTSGILTGANEVIHDNEVIEAILISPASAPMRLKKKAFAKGPKDIMGLMEFPSEPTQGTSGRKPRERKKAEHMTSIEMITKLAAKEADKKKTSSSDSDDRRQTRSTAKAAMLNLRSGRRI